MRWGLNGQESVSLSDFYPLLHGTLHRCHNPYLYSICCHSCVQVSDVHIRRRGECAERILIVGSHSSEHKRETTSVTPTSCHPLTGIAVLFWQEDSISEVFISILPGFAQIISRSWATPMRPRNARSLISIDPRSHPEVFRGREFDAQDSAIFSY